MVVWLVGQENPLRGGDDKMTDYIVGPPEAEGFEYSTMLRQSFVDNYVKAMNGDDKDPSNRKRYTMADLARDLGISRQHLSALYRGRCVSGDFVGRSIDVMAHGKAYKFPQMFEVKKFQRELNDVKYDWNAGIGRRTNATIIS